MKGKSDIRAIDELGRVVIPKTFRKLLGINAGDTLEMNMTEQGEIVITKATPSCVFCGSTENLRELAGKCICNTCVKKLSE